MADVIRDSEIEIYVIKIGDSTGVILPEHMLVHLTLNEADKLYVAKGPTVVCGHPLFART